MKPLISKPIYVALLSVIFLVIFNFTITNIAAPYIAGSLGASNDIATYTITFFALGNAIGMPLSRLLSCRLGSLHLLCLCLVLFAALSYVCTLSESYLAIVIARFVQGFVAGPLFPLVSRILSSLTEEKQRSKTTSCIILISAITPVLGACWGGWIAYDYYWTWIFHLTSPLLLLLSVVFYFNLKGKSIEVPDVAFNIIGYLFYAFGILCIGTAITLGQEMDWNRSSLILWLFAIGIFSFIFYILWDLKHPHPIVHLALFKRFSFSIAMISLALLFSAYFGMVLLLGLWLTLDANYTPLWIGLMIGTMGVAGVLLHFALPKINQTDPRISLLLALIFFAISSFYSTTFAVEIDLFRISISRVLGGFGLALFLAPLFRMSFEKLNPEQSSDAIVIFQVVRSIGSGLGASIYTTVWWRRAVFYHERLGEKLTDFSSLTKDYFAKARLIHIQGLKADAKLADLLDKQSKALALDDCFYLMAWVFVGLALLILLTFLRKKPLIEETAA